MNEMKPISIIVGGGSKQIPLTKVHTLVLGSGAAGLNSAAQLKINGLEDVLILSEGLQMGTSINTGSDKQTYYKLSMSGDEADSPADMAKTYFANGAMHGDLALVESSLSPRGFLNLVNLGMPFPRDEYGQFIGYKTDHDPRQRATSIGPYTSREMCRVLISQVQSLGIPIREKRTAIQLVTLGDESKRVCGLLAVNQQGEFEAYLFENLVFAVGGPGGLYQSSVYPKVHNGAIGLALMAGAEAVNLPESQYGMASTAFRWNVSGTYMQVIPRVISRAADGISDEQEFLRSYFDSVGEMNGMVFLKGYQWPFDARKVMGGSSIVDILIYIETVINQRRVYLDFRSNPKDFSFDTLPEEARVYLEKSGADQDTPIDRLAKMNPAAIELYKDHNIDLWTEALEIGVCAQHNNGGLAGNIWYESTNIHHLFPVGEVNGSHGVARPGGSALNAGQVAGFRVSEFIANRYQGWSLAEAQGEAAIEQALNVAAAWLSISEESSIDWKIDLNEFRNRMTKYGAIIRDKDGIEKAVAEARQHVQSIMERGCHFERRQDIKHAFQVRQLSFAHLVYLDAIQHQIKAGVGSRGSSIVMESGGKQVHPKLSDKWSIAAEDATFRGKVLQTWADLHGENHHKWEDCRPIPSTDAWFETSWARYRDGAIYDQE
ncbi:FAD-binding protein [Chloroflexota bacterium]|nr:FAD-binding protein [Chloroflexota bacterium]